MEERIIEILGSLQDEIRGIKTEMQEMKNQIQVSAVILEDTQRNIALIAENQQAHVEQHEREKEELMREITKKLTLIETAVQSISKDVKDTKEKLNILAEITGKHELEIKVIQRRQEVI